MKTLGRLRSVIVLAAVVLASTGGATAFGSTGFLPPGGGWPDVLIRYAIAFASQLIP